MTEEVQGQRRRGGGGRALGLVFNKQVGLVHQGAFGRKLVHHIWAPGASRAVAGDEKGKVSQGLGIQASSALAS